MDSSKPGIFESLGRLFFNRNQIKAYQNSILRAGFTISAEAFGGFFVLNVFLVSIIISILIINDTFLYSSFKGFFNYFFELPQFIHWIIIFIISIILSYVFIMLFINSFFSLRAENRRNKVELFLPDFLLLVSSNIKAGMALDKAMWYAAKPEFGILSDEVKVVIKGSFSGISMDDSLDILSSRFDSSSFSRTMSLIKQSMSSGGEVSEVLERTATDVRNNYITKREVSASLIMYQIFLFFSSIVGAPFLFAVANKLVQIFESQRFNITGVEASSTFSNVPSFGQFIITSTEFFYFSLGTIFVTALFSSFIIGVIQGGSRSQGLKYLPIMLLLAYGVFWFVDTTLSSFFLSFS